MESNSTAILIKIKLRHSLGRPSRSDFVQSDFAIIKESFEVKRSEAEKAIDRLQKEAENIAAGIERDTEWLEEHRKWKTMPSLTRNVVVSLIQSVKVYEGGDIEIVLDCDDEYRKIVARAGELEKQQDTERLVV